MQPDQSLCKSHEYFMTVRLLTEHNLEFLSLKGGCRGSSESSFVKMPHCWKSHVAAYIMCSVVIASFHNVSIIYNLHCKYQGSYRQV